MSTLQNEKRSEPQLSLALYRARGNCGHCGPDFFSFCKLLMSLQRHLGGAIEMPGGVVGKSWLLRAAVGKGGATTGGGGSEGATGGPKGVPTKGALRHQWLKGRLL